jgi:hypothetical protein
MFLSQVKLTAATVLQGAVLSSLFNIFMGRCTFFAVVFSAVGIIGWLHGRDLASYSLFVGSIQALLVVHSWKEDIRDRNDAKRELEH